MKKKLILILSFLLLNTLTAQQSHYIIMQPNGKQQSFTTATSFPEKWIRQKQEEGYRIEITNFKNGEWFVVMEKKNPLFKQEYKINPSRKKVIQKLKDGYQIKDICYFVEKNNRVKSFYVFDKVSISPQKNWHHSNFYITKKLSELVRKGWDDGWMCQSARCMGYGGDSYYAINMPKKIGNSKQIMEYRVDFPKDFINNKKAKGFILTSITYDFKKKAWLTIMTKKGHNTNNGNMSWGNITTDWTWFNYKTEKELVKDYFSNKNYNIIGVY
jgi:hypothetical protein